MEKFSPPGVVRGRLAPAPIAWEQITSAHASQGRDPPTTAGTAMQACGMNPTLQTAARFRPARWGRSRRPELCGGVTPPPRMRVTAGALNQTSPGNAVPSCARIPSSRGKRPPPWRGRLAPAPIAWEQITSAHASQGRDPPTTAGTAMQACGMNPTLQTAARFRPARWRGSRRPELCGGVTPPPRYGHGIAGRRPAPAPPSGTPPDRVRGGETHPQRGRVAAAIYRPRRGNLTPAPSPTHARAHARPRHAAGGGDRSWSS